MILRFRRFDLQLTHRWTISTSVAQGGKQLSPVVFVELSSPDGLRGYGEAAPPRRYGETADTTLAFLARVDANRLSFEDVPASMAYLATLSPGDFAAKSALNLALLDAASRQANLPLHRWLGLPFEESRHVTSFSIGIDSPEVIRAKLAEAASLPILKIKLGGPDDRATLRLLREVEPNKPIRVDANEAWKTPAEALRQIEWLAGVGGVQFVEQPMPAEANPADLAWLKERSPLPLFADESFHDAGDVSLCADCFHGVNVKLVKTAGVTGAVEALRAATAAGLQTMIGCMIESSLLISAGAHLAALATHLDLDGNLLIANDPFDGVRTAKGVLSFTGITHRRGLCAQPKSADLFADELLE